MRALTIALTLFSIARTAPLAQAPEAPVVELESGECTDEQKEYCVAKNTLTDHPEYSKTGCKRLPMTDNDGVIRDEDCVHYSRHVGSKIPGTVPQAVLQDEAAVTAGQGEPPAVNEPVEQQVPIEPVEETEVSGPVWERLCVVWKTGAPDCVRTTAFVSVDVACELPPTGC